MNDVETCLGSGSPSIRCLMGADAFGGAVAALGALWRRTVNLDQHGIVDIGAERAFDRLQIGLMTVARQLDAIGEPLRNIIHEPLRAFAVATADEVGGDELRVRVHRNPCPNVAGAIGAAFAVATFFCFA